MIIHKVVVYMKASMLDRQVFSYLLNNTSAPLVTVISTYAVTMVVYMD